LVGNRQPDLQIETQLPKELPSASPKRSPAASPTPAFRQMQANRSSGDSGRSPTSPVRRTRGKLKTLDLLEAARSRLTSQTASTATGGAAPSASSTAPANSEGSSELRRIRCLVASLEGREESPGRGRSVPPQERRLRESAGEGSVLARVHSVAPEARSSTARHRISHIEPLKSPVGVPAASGECSPTTPSTRSKNVWGKPAQPSTPSSAVPAQAAARCSSVAQMRSLEAQLQPMDDMSLLSSSLNLYIVGKTIGKGAFGRVSIGVQRLTGEQTAMKLCERKKISELQAKKSLKLEVDVLKMVNGHPNVIQLFEVLETSTHQVLVMEYATGGDLFRLIRQRRRLTEDCAQELFRQLVDGMQYLHGLGVVHRDMKLQNLLLDSFGCLKIADFGVAAILRSSTQKFKDICGTPQYLPPEALQSIPYEGPAADVWSMGIVLYGMVTGGHPFRGDQMPELKRRIVCGKFDLPTYLSAEVTSLLASIIVTDPALRIVLPEISTHPWLAGVLNRAEALYCPEAPDVTAGSENPTSPSQQAEGSVWSDALHRCTAQFGFSKVHLEESLRDGKLNHATTTYHLLVHQHVRKRVCMLPSNLQKLPSQQES